MGEDHRVHAGDGGGQVGGAGEVSLDEGGAGQDADGALGVADQGADVEAVAEGGGHDEPADPAGRADNEDGSDRGVTHRGSLARVAG